MINIAAPIIGAEETAAVNEVLASGMLAQGPKVAELEANFAAYCGTKFALAVNSGTAALHCALFAAGIGPGDEVITTPFSFIATINPIIMQGATPVLVDIEPETFNLDVAKIEAAITPQTKAIIVVDLYGQPYEYAALKTIADKHKLVIIEDACQAIGASYKHKKAGSLGDISCFSLYATKNIMSGEGGVVTTDSESYATAIRQFRQHGMTAQYDYAHLGFNYRLTDLQAAIAVEQLKKVDNFSAARQKNAVQLNTLLAGIKGLTTPVVRPNRSHVYHQYTVRITKEFGMQRDELIDYLRAHGVGAGVYYPKPLHAFKHIAKFGYSLGDLPMSEQAAKQVMSLPIHPKVTKADLETIAMAIKDAARGK